MLEEHSLAIGVLLIQGKKSKPNGGGGGIWRPATLLARSALELVAIRPLLCENERGNLFGNMTRTEKNGGGKATVDLSLGIGLGRCSFGPGPGRAKRARTLQGVEQTYSTQI